jgi:hypothetical protein
MGYGEECALMHRINPFSCNRLTEVASLISEPIPCHIWEDTKSTDVWTPYN